MRRLREVSALLAADWSRRCVQLPEKPRTGTSCPPGVTATCRPGPWVLSYSAELRTSPSGIFYHSLPQQVFVYLLTAGNSKAFVPKHLCSPLQLSPCSSARGGGELEHTRPRSPLVLVSLQPDQNLGPSCPRMVVNFGSELL